MIEQLACYFQTEQNNLYSSQEFDKKINWQIYIASQEF